MVEVISGYVATDLTSELSKDGVDQCQKLGCLKRGKQIRNAKRRNQVL